MSIFGKKRMVNETMPPERRIEKGYWPSTGTAEGKINLNGREAILGV